MEDSKYTLHYINTYVGIITGISNAIYSYVMTFKKYIGLIEGIPENNISSVALYFNEDEDLEVYYDKQ